MRNTFKNILISLRPRQWIKNTFLFAPLLFSKNLFNIQKVLITSLGFVVFCIMSGSVYIFNDLYDRERDKKHPVKRMRPIASGDLQPGVALFSGIVGVFIGLSLGFMINLPFFLIILAYFILQNLYTYRLKNVFILDIFSIAIGFVLRVIAGGVIIHVMISSWLLICTFLLSIFLGLSKRRHELITLGNEATGHKQILSQYSSYLLDQMIGVVTASTLICYILYTVADETVKKFRTHGLIFTFPFVLYGIFRYLYLIHLKGEGGSPETCLLTDMPLLINIFLWALASFLIIYFKPFS